MAAWPELPFTDSEEEGEVLPVVMYQDQSCASVDDSKESDE